MVVEGVVARPVVIAAPVVAAPVVVEPVVAAPSKDDINWSKKLFMVRNIYLGVEMSEVMDRLKQCSGNVVMVVNDLMEEM